MKETAALFGKGYAMDNFYLVGFSSGGWFSGVGQLKDLLAYGLDAGAYKKDCNNPENLTNDLLIPNSLIINNKLADDVIRLKSTKCSLFSIHWNFSENRKVLWALTLVGPTRENLVLDPLAVQHLDNRL